MAHDIKITKGLPATPNEVYDAWTDPKSVAQWMNPGPGKSSKATMDARVGGKFHIDMVRDGTWISPGTEMKRTVVTVELRPVGKEVGCGVARLRSCAVR